MDTYINPHTISSVCESQKRLLSKGESKNEHFSFIVIGSFSVWRDKHIHMPQNYKSKKGFTGKILSPNLPPLMPTQCCFPKVNQCHWFLLDPSRDGLCWSKYTNVFLVLCFSFLLCEDLSWIFKYKSSREGDLDNGRKNVAMEGKRKPVGQRHRLGAWDKLFCVAEILSVRQEGGVLRSWQNLTAMLWGTDLIWLVAGLQQRLLSTRVTCANLCSSGW